MHAPWIDKIPTFTLGGISPDTPCGPRPGKAESNIEEKEYNYSRQPEKVSIVHDAAIGGTTVAESNVHDPNNATVVVNTVPKDILKELSTASQAEST